MTYKEARNILLKLAKYAGYDNFKVVGIYSSDRNLFYIKVIKFNSLKVSTTSSGFSYVCKSMSSQGISYATFTSNKLPDIIRSLDELSSKHHFQIFVARPDYTQIADSVTLLLDNGQTIEEALVNIDMKGILDNG